MSQKPLKKENYHSITQYINLSSHRNDKIHNIASHAICNRFHFLFVASTILQLGKINAEKKIIINLTPQVQF